MIGDFFTIQIRYSITGNKGDKIQIINQTDCFYICIDRIYQMNLQQLEYIIEVDKQRHFQKAAQACNVTQPTLSMMIKKLEEELGEVIFDRSKQPIVPTSIGEKIIAQARRILGETEQLKDLLHLEKGEISGNLRIGVIPTIAPYLMPSIFKQLSAKYSKLTLFVYEYTTETLIQKLKSGELDVGILATPLGISTLQESPIYYERYFLYVNEADANYHKSYILPEEIDTEKLWLLAEGHCLRNQILNLCELKKQSSGSNTLNYEAGSIETLIQLVDNNHGLTIIPELAVERLSERQQKQIKSFVDPIPVREISLVTHHSYVKERMIRVLKEAIIQSIPEKMRSKSAEINVLNPKKE